MLDVILDAVIDTLKIIPILLLVYLLVEFLTHHKEEPFAFLTKKKKFWGPTIGSLLGSIPQCGFSAAMADLYSTKKITLGTLFAVFIATSDEALPIMLANPEAYKEMLILIGFKLIFALLFGYLIDFIIGYKLLKKAKERFENHKINCHDHSCCCNHEEEVHCDHDHCCADNIYIEAIVHTLKISAYILIINLIFGFVLYFVDLNDFFNAISINPYLETFITSLIGLIPNCAGSVFLVELFLQKGITLAATIGGLSAGSGVGIMVLFRKNKSVKESILILISLYLIGVLIGVILTPILA
ncbi:MAG: arsenic efflux protein [Clostridia bacterium]|nr:arsenic efflux protein [Clostridia bacterium]